MADRSSSDQHSPAGAARTTFRGTGRPSRLTFAAAAALAAVAGAAAVATAPAPAAGSAAHFLGSYATDRGSGRLPVTPAVAAAADQARAAAQMAATTRSTSASPAQQAAQDQPLEIYDSVIPAAIPAGAMVATYATGTYAVPASSVAGRPTIWIDAHATDPAASVLDVEPGDATPSMVPAWVTQRLALDRGPNTRARIYTMLAEWPAVQQAVSALPSWMQARIRWWIADPTGVPHMVPGASATQWYWGRTYDISTANPGF